MILLTGDSQTLTHEGQYVLVNKILDYTESRNVKMVITIDGYISWVEEAKPKVICVSTNPQLLRKMLETGTKLGPSGIPIIGITGLTLGLAKFRKIDAACLLGETMGHMPDPKAAKEVLRVLNNFMGLNIDLTLLDKEIEKAKVISTKIKDAQINIEDVLKEQLNKYEKVTYIS
ncbi:MAG: PAC2 family protein [Candidatus Bathyarchaeota archaeon]|nr:MAG: PAC2 family protein [Candidatus Bathyarchaeota archaeon]